MAKCTLLLFFLLALHQGLLSQQDDYEWLEDIDGKASLEFVNAQNKATFEELRSEKDYQTIYDSSLAIYNSSEKIVYPTLRGKYVYNFWKDKDHERGIWRRSLFTTYGSGKPDWEMVLDIDALSKKDSVKWVYSGANGLYPSYNRFLVQLSKGGGDAVVIKEFDADKKEFVADGFYIDEAKGDAHFIDENTVLVTTDFGEGTMTTSGYPLQARLWKRGTLLKDAPIIYKGQVDDAGLFGGVLRDGATTYPFIYRWITSFTSEKLIWADNKIVKLDIPDDCNLNAVLNNQLIIQLKSDWTVDGKTYATGSLLSLNFSALLQGNKDIQLIVEPDALSSIAEVSTTKNHLLVNVLTNITSQVYKYTFQNGTWSNQKVNAPVLGTITLLAADEFSDHYFFQFENFITPSTLFAADAEANTLRISQSLPAYFNAEPYEVNQFNAKSKDGTLVPYFMVSAKDLKKAGTHPTLIIAYGGFEISYQPFYVSSMGKAWLERGGVLVIANIRGGGEFGPKWHQQGLKEKRQNVFDDLYAVSEDLIKQKVTSSQHLGVMGGSNGGLLVGVAFTQRPDLYKAVVCQVPLLDMQRYNKLLAGASWMGEYGNPDLPEEWEYIKKYSPYHNVKAGMNYPEVFFTTSTRDDRVHPGHARKMVAKMGAMGYKTYYYENTEGGHAGSSTNEQRATANALTFSYLLLKLK
jgi:prolyl oligopeptidase